MYEELMQRLLPNVFRVVSIGALAISTLVFAQEPPPPPADSPVAPAAPSGGWKRVGDSAAAYQVPAQTPAPNQNASPGYPAQAPQYPPYQQQAQQPYQAPQPVPPSLTIPRGTFLTVRVNQLLSSDKNQTGDAFSATLAQPLVVNGVVLAEPGQTLGGRVAEAQKAGH